MWTAQQKINKKINKNAMKQKNVDSRMRECDIVINRILA